MPSAVTTQLTQSRLRQPRYVSATTSSAARVPLPPTSGSFEKNSLREQKSKKVVGKTSEPAKNKSLNYRNVKSRIDCRRSTRASSITSSIDDKESVTSPRAGRRGSAHHGHHTNQQSGSKQKQETSSPRPRSPQSSVVQPNAEARNHQPSVVSTKTGQSVENRRHRQTLLLSSQHSGAPPREINKERRRSVGTEKVTPIHRGSSVSENVPQSNPHHTDSTNQDAGTCVNSDTIRESIPAETVCTSLEANSISLGLQVLAPPAAFNHDDKVTHTDCDDDYIDDDVFDSPALNCDSFNITATKHVDKLVHGETERQSEGLLSDSEGIYESRPITSVADDTTDVDCKTCLSQPADSRLSSSERCHQYDCATDLLKSDLEPVTNAKYNNNNNNEIEVEKYVCQPPTPDVTYITKGAQPAFSDSSSVSDSVNTSQSTFCANIPSCSVDTATRPADSTAHPADNTTHMVDSGAGPCKPEVTRVLPDSGEGLAGKRSATANIGTKSAHTSPAHSKSMAGKCARKSLLRPAGPRPVPQQEDKKCSSSSPRHQRSQSDKPITTTPVVSNRSPKLRVRGTSQKQNDVKKVDPALKNSRIGYDKKRRVATDTATKVDRSREANSSTESDDLILSVVLSEAGLSDAPDHVTVNPLPSSQPVWNMTKLRRDSSSSEIADVLPVGVSSEQGRTTYARVDLENNGEITSKHYSLGISGERLETVADEKLLISTAELQLRELTLMHEKDIQSMRDAVSAAEKAMAEAVLRAEEADYQAAKTEEELCVSRADEEEASETVTRLKEELKHLTEALNQSVEWSRTAMVLLLFFHWKDEHDRVQWRIQLQEAKAARELQLKQLDCSWKQTLTEAESAHLSDISLLEEKFENTKNALTTEAEGWRAETQSTQEELERVRESWRDEVKREVETAAAPYKALGDEVNSLTAVLDMKNEELHSLREKNAKLKDYVSRLHSAEEKVSHLEQQVENLKAVVCTKTTSEQELSEKCRALTRRFDRESRTNMRLSQNCEELQFRLSTSMTSSSGPDDLSPFSPNTSFRSSLD